MQWNGWGDPEHDPAQMISESTRALLEQTLGASLSEQPPVPLDQVRPPASRLTQTARAALRTVLGSAGLRDDDRTRIDHCGGKSTDDLLRRRAGDVTPCPDAVLFPASHEELLDVLRICNEQRIAVVPFGGGTSVVGGVEPVAGPMATVVTVDLSRMKQLLHLDEDSHTATLHAGLRTPEVEELLGARGYTLGHLPQSYEYATIGGYAATRSTGQASGGYGRFDDMVVSLRMATPRGTLAPGRSPASAAGPDLRQLVLGSEGTLGIITEVTVRVRPLPHARTDAAWVVPDFSTGVRAMREIARAAPRPTVARLSDETETFVQATLAGRDPAPGSLLVLGFEGTDSEVTRQRAAVDEALRRLDTSSAASGGTHGPAVAADSSAVGDWRRSRFDGPYLRDALLSVGVLTETLETATTWSQLEPLYHAVRDALHASLDGPEGTAIVMCHISHSYPSGASLYLTVATPCGRDPRARWARAKRAASDAIAANGGTITHHHAVGTDHRPWMSTEIGALGAASLAAMKSTLDPAGILNPHKLIPDGPANVTDA
ncbi:FAD-binding oxidoreductase [Lipingzhangella sp. LS1_29]|uniref:FAD-binding oxidoreductase n=1 Tax=Lipingzhangella rawalii TaxID=2055835 RepID=A0ABU2HA17_9ACTN|nr:FAD-binding oxidoreductase [Lipingzhangella rawalii]MDS1272171.1 FAD-binding oxidoreductase [Lipingzhangella rawalii]